jgi:hypothetical protein
MEVILPSKRRLLLLGGALAVVAAPAVLTRPAFADQSSVPQS